jgi:hypothetical protein
MPGARGVVKSWQFDGRWPRLLTQKNPLPLAMPLAAPASCQLSRLSHLHQHQPPAPAPAPAQQGPGRRRCRSSGPQAPRPRQKLPQAPPETDLVSEVSVWGYSVWVWAWAWPACTQGGAGVYALPDGVIRSDELTSAMPSGTPGHRPSAISRPARPGLLMAYISFALVLRVR